MTTIPGAVDGWLDEVGVGRGGEDGGLHSPGHEELGHVDHWEHVALGHEREEEDVEAITFRAHEDRSLQDQLYAVIRRSNC